VVPHVKSGRLRALAVSSPKRLPMLPDVPTFKEAGISGFEASVWWGFVAPAKTPKDVVARLESEVLKALENDAVRDKLVSLGAVVEPMNSAQFGQFLKSEVDKWARVIKSAKITEE
jgi:tripartite-type tricarboxylate transporter receptor subunit TctC